MSIPLSISLLQILELILEVLLFQFSEPIDDIGLCLKRDAIELLISLHISDRCYSISPTLYSYIARPELYL